MLAITWQYLTGRCVATDFTDRHRAEWPPHPDRVFQALVASWGERGENAEERAALELLENCGAPGLVVPDLEDRPDPLQVFVPVNDTQTDRKVYTDAMLRLLPEKRERKERYFPSVVVGDGVCALVWPESEPTTEQAASLAAICAGVTRIGHSSSLVLCRVTDTIPGLISHVPAPGARRRDFALRVPGPGRLKALIEHHQAIADGKIDDLLPPRAREVGYVRPFHGAVKQGAFAAPLLVFRRVGGRPFGLARTLELCDAFRRALIPHAQAVSADLGKLVSGHAVDGSPLRDEPHLAFLPLAFAGHEHADGHLLGMGVAFPRACSPTLEDGFYKALAKLMVDGARAGGESESDTVRLVAGGLGEMHLALEDRGAPPRALVSETWCRQSQTWATMTPIVMDRMQNARRSEPVRWAAEQIRRMLERQGLPPPVRIVIRPVSFLVGAPSVREYRPLLRKDGSSRRMVHAHLEFQSDVGGPLLLGAGRFKGYGFCKPCARWEDSDARS